MNDNTSITSVERGPPSAIPPAANAAPAVNTANPSRTGKRQKFGGKRNNKPYDRKQNASLPSISSRSVQGPGRSVLMTYPDRPVFPILCGNEGIGLLSQTVFSAIQARDHRAVSNISWEHLGYATCIAYFWRCVRVATLKGYLQHSPRASDLRNAISGIRFPAVICDYIESLGVYETAFGVAIGPWVSHPESWYAQLGMLRPQWFLTPLDRIGEGPWELDWTTIQEWNAATTRPASRSMGMRTILFDVVEGQVNLLATLLPHGNLCEGVSLVMMTDTEAKTGAAYRWRSVDEAHAWPGDTRTFCSAVCRSEAFPRETFLNELVVSSFVDPTL